MEKATKEWEQWLEKQVETLYEKDTESLIHTKLKPAQIQKHISMLEATKANDQDYFWKDVCRANLLAYLYLHPDIKRIKDAKELIQKSLEIEPTSVAALTNNFQLAKIEKKSQKAKEVVEQLNTLVNSKDAKPLHIVAGAEVAYCLEYLGPAFYMSSIEKYEKVFSDLSVLTQEEKSLAIVSNKLRMWQFHLAQTYNRMMNRGNTIVLFLKRYDKDLRDVFQRTTRLLLDIIESKDPTYYGKALVDLVDFYKKYETNGGDPKTTFPYKKGPDDCINDAYNLSTQKDPYVLERCGRHYRQRANNENDFLYAAKVLQEAVDLCETRHVAWHHLGLTYRSLWLNAGRHKESRLSTNKARKGSTKPRKKKFQQNGANSSKQRSSGTEEHRKTFEHANASYNIQQGSQNPTGQNSRDDIWSQDSGINLSTVDVAEGKTDNVSNTRFSLNTSSDLEELNNIPKPQRLSVQSATKERNLTTPPQALPTLLPTFPSPLGNTPRHHNKPDYLDKYRVSNPTIQQTGTTDKATGYFNKAVECLKKATELANNTSCRYLLDLGRLYVSQENFEDAEECFHLAEDTEPNDNDAQFLYEQWALLRVRHPDEDSNGVEDIKDMYRHSIRSALKANVKSKIAFYNLQKILEDERKNDPNDELLHLELAVLLCNVKKFNQAEEMLKTLLESLNNDPKQVNIVWQLIALYNQRGQKHDAAAAYTYLTALEKAGQLHLEVDELSKNLEVDELSKNRINIIIQLARKDYEENETEKKLKSIRHLTLGTDHSSENHDQCSSFKPSPYFKDVFRWVVGNKTLSERGFKGKDENMDNAYKETDICLLAFENIKSETTNTTASRLWKLLQDWCDLGEGVSCLPDDIDFCHRLDQAATAILSKAKAVAIVLDDRRDEIDEQQATIQEMIEKLKRLKIKKNICFVVGENLDSEYRRDYGDWPCFVLNQECTDCCNVSSFFQFLFCATSS